MLQVHSAEIHGADYISTNLRWKRYKAWPTESNRSSGGGGIADMMLSGGSRRNLIKKGEKTLFPVSSDVTRRGPR